MEGARGTPQPLGRWVRSVGVLAIVSALVLPGCGVVWDAPDIGLTMRDEDVVYTQVDAPDQLTGGETVLEVANASSSERQIVVAHVPEGERIPSGILEAESAREDDRIIGYSRVLEPQEMSTGNGFGRRTEQARFHIHLRPGERYVVFDALAGPEGPVRWIEPGPNGDRAVAVAS